VFRISGLFPHFYLRFAFSLLTPALSGLRDTVRCESRPTVEMRHFFHFSRIPASLRQGSSLRETVRCESRPSVEMLNFFSFHLSLLPFLFLRFASSSIPLQISTLVNISPIIRMIGQECKNYRILRIMSIFRVFSRISMLFSPSCPLLYTLSAFFEIFSCI